MTQMTFRENKYSKVARKGPRRYYRLHEEDLLLDEEYYTKHDTSVSRGEEEFQIKLKNQILRNYTLSPVYQSLGDGNNIEVYRSVLTVGAHAQISWLSEEQVWVIGNHSASVFIKNIKDLDKYKSAPKPLFIAVIHIARFWIKYFKENVKDKKGFIKAIEAKTLCATFVNPQNHSNLLKYDRPCMLFHAIVDNESHNDT